MCGGWGSTLGLFDPKVRLVGGLGEERKTTPITELGVVEERGKKL